MNEKQADEIIKLLRELVRVQRELARHLGAGVDCVHLADIEESNERHRSYSS